MKKLDDTFLARWLEGGLTPEEEREFKTSKDYDDYKRIMNVVDNLKEPTFNEDKAYASVRKSTIEKVKIRKVNFNYVYGIAASILVFLGVFYMLNLNEKTYNSTFGEQLAIVLPDGSEATLNANSSLLYDERKWKEERTVELKGEAYFKVEKGSAFKVITKEGVVEVLGTQFNVNASKNFLEVKCYTGKVSVSNKSQDNIILTSGKAYRTANGINENWGFNTETIFWKKGANSFIKMPLPKVIYALENQFNIQIKQSKSYNDKRFTGRFYNNDRDLALKTVFDAMSIQYTVDGNTVKLK